MAAAQGAPRATPPRARKKIAALTRPLFRASATQDEFSTHKQTLIDKETKKRMLEELWHDRVDVPAEDGTAPSDCVRQSAGFSLIDFDKADVDEQNRTKFASDLLTRLENVDARVIVLCVHPRVLRALLATA